MGAAAVKNNKTAYALYKERFAGSFGREPLCPTGCGSSQGKADWNDFTRLVSGESIESIKSNSLKYNDMSTTFEIKDKLKIYRFQKEVNGHLKTFRSYGYAMTEEFAENYVEAAKDETDKKDRLHIFKTVPAKFREATPEEIEATKLLNDGNEGDNDGKGKEKTLKDYKLKELKLLAPKFEPDALKDFKTIDSLADFLHEKGITPADIETAIIDEMS